MKARPPSPWEPSVVTHWRGACVKAARRVKELSAVDMETEDAIAELLIAVVDVCRKWQADGHDDSPPPQLVQAAITGRRHKLLRSVVRHRPWREPNGGEVVVEIPGDNADPVELLDQTREHAASKDAVAFLRGELAAPRFAALYLRHAGEMTPVELSGHLGGDLTPAQVSRLIHKAKDRAREILAAAGMTSMTDVYTRPELPPDGVRPAR